MNIPIRHKITDEILFEHDCKDNTQKITLELAIKKDVLLYNADLHDADLCDADLYGAGLRKADLCDANLYGADLCKADLCDANLMEKS
ncbi:MAG: pentapeptide repeat-containing protein [Candidatus Aminicenantes bacterium]|nr:MAG: pentapeptide repeat-containing protein [Candidatus Aminicenantes bacterium]